MSLINREELIADLLDARKDETDTIPKLVRFIKAQPTVEPKRGRWIVVEEELNDCDGHRTFYWRECDSCGARPPKNQWGHEWHSKYCPNCGARMEIEDESD